MNAYLFFLVIFCIVIIFLYKTNTALRDELKSQQKFYVGLINSSPGII